MSTAHVARPPLEPSVDESLLAHLAEAYRAGRSIHYERERITANDPYWGMVEDILATRVPLTERLVFRRCRRSLGEGLNRARRGELASAAQQFAEVKQLLESPNRHEEVRFLIRTVFLAATGYLSYRRARYPEARHQIEEALGLDVLLENDYGYLLLHLHRMTLLSNLARITMREYGPEEAVRPQVDLLLYLEGALPNLPYLAPSKVGIEAMPADIVCLMMYGFAADLAVLWSSLGPGERAHSLPTIRPIALKRGTPRFQARIAGAFRLKGASLADLAADGEGALLSALAAGRAEAPRLWYALVLDLARLLARNPLTLAQDLRKEISRDAASWQDLPPVLRPELLAEPVSP